MQTPSGSQDNQRFFFIVGPKHMKMKNSFIELMQPC
jgi:hypothetical protein